MFRVLIVEDKTGDAAALSEMLLRYGQDHATKFHIKQARSVFDVPESQSFDLIFLDIGLPGITGMEMAEALRMQHDQTPLVFVTDLAQYAVKGYQVDALDFMMKPLEYYDFALRMNRVLRICRRNDDMRISIGTKGGARVVSIKNIVYLDVNGHTLSYYLANDEVLSLRGALGRAADYLPDDRFVRISNSCLVNMGHIQAVRSGCVVVDLGESLYFSRPKHKEALVTITNYLGGSL